MRDSERWCSQDNHKTVPDCGVKTVSKSDRDGMLISTFAAVTGITVESVRYGERRGLLQTCVVQFGRGRRYNTASVARVTCIKATQSLGFTLVEVADLLRLDNGHDCRATQALAVTKLATVRDKLETLRRAPAHHPRHRLRLLAPTESRTLASPVAHTPRASPAVRPIAQLASAPPAVHATLPVHPLATASTPPHVPGHPP